MEIATAGKKQRMQKRTERAPKRVWACVCVRESGEAFGEGGLIKREGALRAPTPACHPPTTIAACASVHRLHACTDGLHGPQASIRSLVLSGSLWVSLGRSAPSPASSALRLRRLAVVHTESWPANEVPVASCAQCKLQDAAFCRPSCRGCASCAPDRHVS